MLNNDIRAFWRKKKRKRMREDEYPGENRMNDGREKRGMKPNRPPPPVSGSYNEELNS